MTSSKHPSADIVTGLGWGDEGKGVTTAALVVEHGADRVVRFNGGQQAMHNVVHNGLHHPFASYGSGTFSGVPTFIGPLCTADPLSALNEQESLLGKGVLTDQTRTIRVHEDVKVTTPLHIFVNHAKETLRGDNRHGSTGTGFGETIAWEYYGNDPLRVKDVASTGTGKSRTDAIVRTADWMSTYSGAMGLDEMFPRNEILVIAERMIDAAAMVFTTLCDDDFLESLSTGHTVFEGAQGFMLDENLGLQPHTTWSTTTPHNARVLADQAGIDDVTVYGAMRTYATRHGAGPLPHEGEFHAEEMHNPVSQWAGGMRTAPWVMDDLDWAVSIVKPDFLSVGHLDLTDGKVVTSDGMISLDDLDTPAGITGYGPEISDRKFVH